MGWFRELFKDFGDQVLMLILALALCVFLVGAFWIADEHRINAIWVFVAWNSIVLMPIFIRLFGSHLKKPSFVLFLIAWMVIHGLFVAVLMRRIPIFYWPIPISLELMAGGMVANWRFGITPSDVDVDDWRLKSGKDNKTK